MKTLYESSFEHDACGIGAVVSIDGIKSHRVVENALSIVEKLEHRAGKDASGETGDGVGILVQISHSFFKKIEKEAGLKLGDERDYGVGQFFFPADKYEDEKKRFEKLETQNAESSSQMEFVYDANDQLKRVTIKILAAGIETALNIEILSLRNSKEFPDKLFDI